MSLLIALILWTIAYNFFNPLVSETFVTTLTLLNEDSLLDNNFILANREELLNKKVSLRVRLSQQEINSLKRSSTDIKAELDLKPVDVMVSQISSENRNFSASINYKLPGDYGDENIYYKSDFTANVVLDRLATKYFDVRIRKTGEVAQGFASLDATSDPPRILISGAQSIIENIEEVYAEVDVANISAEYVARRDLIAVNKIGENVTTSVSLGEKDVMVSVPVYKRGEAKINPPSRSGSPARGYIIADVSYEPKIIEIVGEPQYIDNFPNIDLETIDVSGRSETFEKSFNLGEYFANNNVNINYKGQAIVKVTISIEKIETRGIILPIGQVDIKKPNLPVEIFLEDIIFTVSGPASLIQSLKTTDIKAELDLSKLTAGSYYIAPNIITPDLIEIEEDPDSISVTIYQAE
jgi:YbbR domain-containing protein